MIWNLISLIGYGIVGCFFCLMILFFVPKRIRGKVHNWYSNWVFRSAITKFKKIIEYGQTPEQKELHDRYSFLGKHKDYIENRYKELNKFEEIQLKYLRLRERNKFNEVMIWQLTMDWKDWVDLVDRYTSELDSIVRYGMEPDFDRNRQDRIGMEEIEKRFEEIL